MSSLDHPMLAVFGGILERHPKTHPRITNGCIHQLVYLRHGKRILGTSLIEVREVHAYSPLSCLLFYHHRIGQPLRIKNFFDSPSLLKLGQLTSDSFSMLF